MPAQQPRLYCKAKVLGFKRGKHNQHEQFSLLAIEGVQTPEDAKFYCGKHVAYVYRAKKVVNGTNVRIIWGKIARSHGNSGIVKARFRKNLPPRSMGAPARVMLYPSRI